MWVLIFFSCSHLSVPKVKSCADVFTPEFDAIYTDYNGLTYMNINMPPNMSPYRYLLV